MENLYNDYLSRLSILIANYGAITNIDGLSKNLNIIKENLLNLGFEISLHQKEGSSDIIIAKKKPISCSSWVGLYGHYDVEILEDGWLTDPLKVIQKDGRLYCRGIADNLGILLLRILALEHREPNQATPGLFWVLQGEEEIGSPYAHEIFPSVSFPPVAFWCEETGYFDIATQRQRVLIVNENQYTSQALAIISKTAAENSHPVYTENRFLTKAFGNNKCPFLCHIVKNNAYIAFGPNDELSKIHQPNESLAEDTIKLSFLQFNAVLNAIAQPLI